MKCPNCGEEIAEGYLYCAKCGEDIHIVPDFEPELDHDIQQTIKHITDDIWEKPEMSDKDKSHKDKSHKDKSHKDKADKDKSAGVDWDGLKSDNNQEKRRRFLGGLITVAVMVVLSVAVVWGFRLWSYHSLDYQTTMARDCVWEESYEEAIAYYERAIELDADNVTLKVELADVYFLHNDKITYEALLESIVQNENATSAQLESSYGKLIAIYRSRNDMQAINDLLLSSNNEEILNTYKGYVAMEPQFSVQEGYYNTLQPLKLSTYGTAEIYYTLDGSDPDENSIRYTIPILLDDGEYLIKAVCISENGTRSKVVKKEYHITIDELKSPEISVMTGEYDFPTNIEVLDEGEPVYYTMDGTTPTENSALYTGPIPMPLGESEFQFIRIGNGLKSDVEVREYELVMHTEFMPGDAVALVGEYCVEIEQIEDSSGAVEDSDDRYLFYYQYVTNINGVDDFYVIKESIQNSEGIISDTGIYYAVNAYTKELFYLQINGPNYNLVEIEREIP